MNGLSVREIAFLGSACAVSILGNFLPWTDCCIGYNYFASTEVRSLLYSNIYQARSLALATQKGDGEKLLNYRSVGPYESSTRV